MQTIIAKITTKSSIRRINRAASTLVIVSLLSTMLLPIAIQPVKAATLTSIKDTLSTVKASTVADHTFTFTTPTGVGAGQTIILTFESFNPSALAFGDVDFTDDGVDLVLAATASGASWGIATSSSAVTITSGTATIAAASVITVELGLNATFGVAGDTQITNPAAGNYDIDFTGTFTDTGAASVSIIANDVVNITSTVDEYVTFTVSDLTIGFGTLSTTTGRWATGDALGGDASGTTPTAAHTMTLATNARSGWAITYKGATLTSGSDTITDAATIDEDSDGTPGSEQFGISASTDGNSTIAAGYLRDAVADFDYVVSTTTTLVSEAAGTATETISASYLANITTTTEPGSYSTNITYVATATF